METIDRLGLCRLFFELDGDTVVWVRKPSNSLFGGAGWERQFLAKRAGRPVKFHRTNKFGHLSVSVRLDGRNFNLLAHRVVWALSRGAYPACDIDHIDNDPANNRPANLRLATRSQNSLNAKRNKVGLKGAYRQNGGKWFSMVWDGSRLRQLGTFPTERAAHEAWIKAKAELAGEFFNPGYSTVFD
jgi:hypothetical protein